jgi:hypothetical protein
MKWALTDLKAYTEALPTPNFYHVMDGQHLSRQDKIKRMQE